MPPEVKPPTQAEIEQALKGHLASNPPHPGGAENSEIGAALAQFEKEQGGMATPQYNQSVDVMKSQKIEVPDSAEIPKMVQRLIRWSGGAIKDQKQAEITLFILAVLMFGISMYLFWGSNSDNAIPPSFKMMQQQNRGLSGSSTN